MSEPHDIPGDNFIVICKDEGFYTLATRRVFQTRKQADVYVGSVATSREPLVISGRWFQLRPHDET